MKPTQADVAIADDIAAHTGRPTEHIAEALTWGADERVLCALALGWWLYARTHDVPGVQAIITAYHDSRPNPPARPQESVCQERPDRFTVLGHIHGIPLSGKRLDAFPSGHAVHIGALASAATGLRRPSVTSSGRSEAVWSSRGSSFSLIGQATSSPVWPSGPR